MLGVVGVTAMETSAGMATVMNVEHETLPTVAVRVTGPPWPTACAKPGPGSVAPTLVIVTMVGLLDVQVATVRNSNNADFSLEANLPGNADNPLPGHSQSGVYAGIEHSF